jgi:phage/plasmid-like protein (TIGR03299 family)
MFRDDTGNVLDVTGKGYVPHQNIEVLEFFAEYLNAGAMYIDTAGALNGGRQIWVQAKMDGGFTLPGDDVVQGRILLMNPHQYGKGMIAKFVAERVVCWNTLTMALGESGKSVKIWHTAEFNKARQDEVKRDLGIANERLDAFKADAKKLVSMKLEVQDAINILAPVLDGKKDEPLEQQGKTMTRVVELWQGAGKGAALKSANGTAWGLLNGVTQYYDHEYGRTADSRLTMAWLGDGEVRKRKSMAALLQVAA